MAVDYISPQTNLMHKRFSFIDDLKGGTDAILAKGKEYLIQGAMETDKSFEQRIKHSLYTDFFNPTVKSITGLIFQDDITYSDLDTKLDPFIQNADGMGTHFDLVLSTAFRGGLEKGLKYALVDMPNMIKESLADEMSIEPYTTLIDASNVLNYKTEVINGKTVLSQVTIREVVEKDTDDEFEVELVEQFRVLRIGSWQIYTRDAVSKSTSVSDEGVTNLNYIPLFWLNLDDDGVMMEAKPPLYEMGKLCINHYRGDSEINYALWTANVPIRTMTGIREDEAKGMTISNNTIMRSDNENAKFDFWQFDPKGVTFAETKLQTLKGEIAKEGLGAISGKSQMTATENVLDNIKTQSKLLTMARKLEDFAENILICVADFKGMNTEMTGKVTTNIKLDGGIDFQMLNALSGAVAKGTMSLEVMYKYIETGKLPDGFEVDKMKTEISVGTLE